MARFEMKVRKWANRVSEAKPFDVVIMDNSTGKMHCSLNTYESTVEANKTLVSLSMKDESYLEVVTTHWTHDGNKEAFNELPTL